MPRRFAATAAAQTSRLAARWLSFFILLAAALLAMQTAAAHAGESTGAVALWSFAAEEDRGRLLRLDPHRGRWCAGL